MQLEGMIAVILLFMVLGVAFGGALYIAVMSFIFSFGFYILCIAAISLIGWLVILSITRK